MKADRQFSMAGLEAARAAVQGTRGKVRGRSRRSVKRLVERLAGYYGVFLRGSRFTTLTYGKRAPDMTGAKRQFETFREALRRRVPDCAGLWVAEYQRRGAPHFHLLTTYFDVEEESKLKADWLRIAGMNGSRVADRGRYGWHSEEFNHGEEGTAVSLYLAKAGARELAKKGQQNAKAHTGRTWGFINRNAMEAYRVFAQETFLDRAELEAYLYERASAMLEDKVLKPAFTTGAGTPEETAHVFPRLWMCDDQAAEIVRKAEDAK